MNMDGCSSLRPSRKKTSIEWYYLTPHENKLAMNPTLMPTTQSTIQFFFIQIMNTYYRDTIFFFLEMEHETFSNNNFNKKMIILNNVNDFMT